MTVKALVLVALICMTACSTQERKDAGGAKIKKSVASEIERICALPEPERDAELKKLKERSGMELYCAEK